MKDKRDEASVANLPPEVRALAGGLKMVERAMAKPKPVDRHIEALRHVVAGYDYNPGSSDLDDEQPIDVQMTLGDYRRIRSLLYRMEHPDGR
jgi:hypothetical protein